MRSKKTWVVAAIVAAAALASTTVAVATIMSTVLTDTTSVRLRIDRTHFVPSADQSVFNSGWHTHPGPVIFQVQQGRVKITQGPCHPTVVGPGETYIEAPHVPVLATAQQEATWTVTLVVPAGTPLRTDVPSPC